MEKVKVKRRRRKIKREIRNKQCMLLRMLRCLYLHSWVQGLRNNNVRIHVVFFKTLVKAVVSLLSMMGMDLQEGKRARLQMTIFRHKFRNLPKREI